MTLIVLIAISLSVAAGVYLSLSRDLFRVIVGLTVLGASTNLIVFSAGRLTSTTPPLLGAVADVKAAASADPLVQALVLTAIVISFALLCFALVLGARLRSVVGTDDTEEFRAAEPRCRDAVKPPEMED
jgi:multicomponent Na+:H+ antiporter subunit C